MENYISISSAIRVTRWACGHPVPVFFVLWQAGPVRFSLSGLGDGLN